MRGARPTTGAGDRQSDRNRRGGKVSGKTGEESKTTDTGGGQAPETVTPRGDQCSKTTGKFVKSPRGPTGTLSKDEKEERDKRETRGGPEEGVTAPGGGQADEEKKECGKEEQQWPPLGAIKRGEPVAVTPRADRYRSQVEARGRQREGPGRGRSQGRGTDQSSSGNVEANPGETKNQFIADCSIIRRQGALSMSGLLAIVLGSLKLFAVGRKHAILRAEASPGTPSSPTFLPPPCLRGGTFCTLDGNSHARRQEFQPMNSGNFPVGRQKNTPSLALHLFVTADPLSPPQSPVLVVGPVPVRIRTEAASGRMQRGFAENTGEHHDG
ncbi:unnamed protein product, partial [Pleuronectes platessa]